VAVQVSKHGEGGGSSLVLQEWLGGVCFDAVEDLLFEHVQPLLGGQALSCDEYSLIQYLEAQNIFEGLEDVPATLGLFAKHFTVRRCFYRLQVRFSQLGWGIDFELMHLRFHAISPVAVNAGVVAHASDRLIAEFYEDTQTLAQATAGSVNKLLADFWVRFEAFQRADSAYEALGVAVNATWPEIQHAYRVLAAKHHPDKGGDTAAFVAIQSAYDRLKVLN
jgi:hypothetical protein